LSLTSRALPANKRPAGDGICCAFDFEIGALGQGDSAMAVKKENGPSDNEHRGETGARKFPARPGTGNFQNGISRGGTNTGDPSDQPPKEGYGLTEPVIEKTPKSKGVRRSRR
jgi:hypothetical protein